MLVVVASHNPVKIDATRMAFETRMPDKSFEVIGVSVASGVNDQPMSDKETRRGARNRVDNAREARPDADFWVGMEGGLDYYDAELTAFAWMAVAAQNGRTSQARTPTLPLPPGIQKLVESGLELGDANDRVFSTLNSKQGGGAFGLLTDGVLTRGGIYAQTLMLAMIPQLHPLWNDKTQP